MIVKYDFDFSEIKKEVENLLNSEPTIFEGFTQDKISKLLSLPDVFLFTQGEITRGADGCNVVVVKVKFRGDFKTLVGTL